ncbi:MAG TPA: PQQ-dependent sugar dehydrogenase, partial [Pirellulaceae bacterium]|nr:PQQ-dependent sugar dehydrogenase [Pirellulaceae bacterium]
MLRPLLGLAILISCFELVARAGDADKPVRKPFGLEKRVPWTTSNVVGYPEPPPPYRTERVFPKLSFAEPLDLAAQPGGKRLWVAERRGKLFSFVQDPAVSKADIALELSTKNDKGEAVPQTIYAFTFHPKFAENGYVYVTWIPDGSKEGIPNGTRVSRFTAKGEPPVIDRASEKVIIEWPNGGHNGGCLKFGPDGMLYIVTGDGSGIADELQIGQDLSSILGKILRIDVDHPAEDKGYSVPKDNPFVAMKDARPETWAYGLRQFWRFSFDRQTGQLWGGEIGQDLWESVHRIQKGGNYGWSVMEATHPFRPERKKGPTPILQPVVEHSHSDFRSITGGTVYRGKRLPELAGHFIYGDFDTGRIWAFRLGLNLREDDMTVSNAGIPLISDHRELARTNYRVITFAEDAAGELLFLDFTGGGLHQLVKAPPVEQAAKPFPTKLSQTGLFASTKDHTPTAGLIPYSVNSQLWSDH